MSLTQLAERLAILKAAGFTYTTHNHDQHVVITVVDHVFDYWPSTNKWRQRGFDNFDNTGFSLTLLLEQLALHRDSYTLTAHQSQGLPWEAGAESMIKPLPSSDEVIDSLVMQLGNSLPTGLSSKGQQQLQDNLKALVRAIKRELKEGV